MLHGRSHQLSPRGLRGRSVRLALAFAGAVGPAMVLECPVAGRTYRVARPSSPDVVPVVELMKAIIDRPVGMSAAQVFSLSEVVPELELDGEQSDRVFELMLGDTYGRMLLDGVPPEVVQHAAETVIAWLALGADQAIFHWQHWFPASAGVPSPAAMREG